MEIKDYLQQYVKSQALRLGGESAINEIDAPGLVYFEEKSLTIQDWAGDTIVFEGSGNRTVIKSNTGTPLYLQGSSINTGEPVAGGTVNIPLSVTLNATNDTTIISNSISLLSQANTSFLTLRSGSSDNGGIMIQPSVAGGGNLRILLVDTNGNPCLPTGTASLVPGQIWNDNGTLKYFT